VVAWQSEVGGSATTAKFNMPPFFGLWATAGDAIAAAANSAARDKATLGLIWFPPTPFRIRCGCFRTIAVA
jgi:hypothetical protein